jgi:hypothetical protein
MMWLLLGLVGFVSLVVVPVLINKSTEHNLDWIRPRLREAWSGVGVIYATYILSTDTVKLWFVSWRNGFGSQHPELSYLALAGGATAIAFGYWHFLGRLLPTKKSTEAAAEKEQPPKNQKLVIHSAYYGTGDATDVSVTDRLNAATRDALVIPVNNSLVSGEPDPAPNQYKRLKITYSYGSMGATVSTPEHSWTVLPEDPRIQRLTAELETEKNKPRTNWREKFANPQWEIIRDRKFENETVSVDGKSFTRCSFKNVKLLFHGTAPFEFQPGTEFDKGSIMFGTDDPAVALYDSIQTKIATIPGAKLALKDAKGHDIPLARVRVEPKITRVNHEFEDSTGNVAYPLKMRVQFRNDSPMSIGVAVSEYVRGEAPIQDPLPIGVLQVKLGDEWLPVVNGQQKIAVLPGQLFRVWIGFDRTRISRAQLEGMWGGRLGTLVLLADETPVEVPL